MTILRPLGDNWELRLAAVLLECFRLPKEAARTRRREDGDCAGGGSDKGEDERGVDDFEDAVGEYTEAGAIKEGEASDRPLVRKWPKPENRGEVPKRRGERGVGADSFGKTALLEMLWLLGLFALFGSEFIGGISQVCWVKTKENRQRSRQR